MTVAAWVCDSCETNNLATASVCRVCHRQPGSTTGTVAMVPDATKPPDTREQAPTFVASKHAVMPPTERARITLTPPPPTAPPRPAPPTPRRPPAPPVDYRLPARLPRAPRSGSGRVVWRVVLVIVGLVVLSKILSAVTDGRGNSDPDYGANGIQSQSVACPAAPASYLPEAASLVAAYTTERHVITICETASGQLYYDGQLKDQLPNEDTHLSILAERTATGFIAYNGTFAYEITGQEVVVTNNGAEISRLTLTKTAG